MNETWQKSSYSMGENNCVETRTVPVAGKTQAVQVRDTKDHSWGTLNIGAQAWQEFIRL